MNIGIYISPFMDPPIMPGIKIISTIHDITFLKIDIVSHKKSFNKYS